MSSTGKRRYYRKQVELFALLKAIKLWPARSGMLHGVKVIKDNGLYAEITTHCNHTFVIRNSKTSRAARWLRNKWFTTPCPQCKIPAWKLEKYGQSSFCHDHGASLKQAH